MINFITKRDGRKVSFDIEKIISAIMKAMISVDVCDRQCAKSIAYKIYNISDTKIVKDGVINIEDVQDLVETELMHTDYPKVAKAYITYREERNKQRRLKSKIRKNMEDIMACRNIENSNANLDEFSFSGRENRCAEILQKEIALDGKISEVVANAYKNDELYIHDLSKYAVGQHNCIFTNLKPVLNEGFSTRNCGIRPASNFATACQLIAVEMQCSSQSHFGGIASMHIDTDLAPFVFKSFLKHYKTGVEFIEPKLLELYKNLLSTKNMNELNIESEFFKTFSEKVYNYAITMLEKEGKQAAEGLFHNLNTLESRPGAQLPFTSINFARDTTPEGRKVSEWMLKASLAGTGPHNQTPIFPISVFQYKKGTNAKKGDPNYNLKKLAIESLAKRIYPNIVNGDWSQNIEDPNNPDTFMATMGCRTLIGYDRHGLGYSKVGRGNACPVTINLPKLGIDNGICLNKRTKPDIEGFFKDLDRVLKIAEKSLVERFYHICSQDVRSGMFLYANKTIADAEKALEHGIYESMKHFTLAIGYIGIAETCKAMFGIDHSYGIDYVDDFAEKILIRISDFAKEASERNNLNFGCYATPAENLCKTFCEKLKARYGELEDITSRGYLTNSHHVPVWRKISIHQKLRIEARYTKYPTSGCITYIELDSSIMKNYKAIEQIIDYAMDLDIPYLAFNFPIDTCNDCGFQGDIKETCPVCNKQNILRLRRVTGYLTTDYNKFNAGKIKECKDRVKHSDYINMGAIL